MKRVRWLLYLLVSILINNAAYAQSEQLVNYTVKDGLSGNVVYHILSDSKGYLWIGTSLGVSRFDGREFVNYSVLEGLPDNDVFISEEDNQGRIWFGTYKADLSYYQHDSIHSFKYNEEVRKLIPDKTVKLGYYFSESGDVFVANRTNSLIRIDSAGDIEIIGGYECSIVDFGDKVLTAQYKNYAYSAPNRRKQGYRIYDAQNDFKVIDSNYVAFNENSAKGSHYSIKTGPQSYLLIKGEYIWHISQDTSYYTVSPYYLDCIFMDEGGQVWLGTHNNGIYVFSDVTLTDTIGHLLDGQTITHVTKDFEGGIWISSLGHGIYHMPKIDYEQLKGIGLPQGNIVNLTQGPEKSIFAQYDNGDVWYGFDKKWQLLATLQDKTYREPNVMYYEDADKTFYVKANEIISAKNIPFSIRRLGFREDVNPSSYLFDIGKYKNQLLEIRGRGIYTLGIEDRLAYNKELFNAGISDVIEHDDTLWIGSLQGLFYMVNDSIYSSNHPVIRDKHVLQIIYWNNERIIVTENHGLLIENGTKYEWINNKHILPKGITRCQLDEYGILWIGSQKGLYYLDLGHREEVKKISAQQGIWNEKVNDLLSINGEIFIAEDHGLIKIKKSSITQTSVLPPKIYTSIYTVNGKKWNLNLGTLFEYDQNNIEIKMTSVSYTNQEDRVFQWKFKESGKEWNTSNSDILAFSGLSPKPYTLLVRSRNVSGIWSDISELNFIIEPAFWQRKSFLAFSILVLAIVIFCIFYLYLRALKNKAKRSMELLKEKSDLEIRALRAQMNPHFVFNSLTSIQYLINLNKNKEAEFYLNKFSRLLRVIVDRAGQTEITLLNELDLLRIFVDLENLRYEDKFEFNVDIDDEIEIDQVVIPGIILQPFIENAIEHGLAKKEEKGVLYLGIKKEGRLLKILIEDDGIGRKKSTELRKISGKMGQSVGVRNVKRRIELLQTGNQEQDYSFEIEDLTDEKGDACGTRIKLTIPYRLHEA